MDQQKNETYPERSLDDHELARQLDIVYFKDWIELLPKQQREKKSIVMGPKAYSPQDILDVISKDEPDAEVLRAFLRELRLLSKGATRR